jgi:hypothetical protein
VPFGFERYEPSARWEARFFVWTDTLLDPHKAPGNLGRITAQPPVLRRSENRLDFQWYRPRFGLPQERWAMDATTTVDIPAGEHSIRTISDDAVRVWVDDALVIDRPEPGGSEVQYAPISPGRRTVRVAFHQLTGWTELRVDFVRGSARSTGSAGPH